MPMKNILFLLQLAQFFNLGAVTGGLGRIRCYSLGSAPSFRCHIRAPSLPSRRIYYSGHDNQDRLVRRIPQLPILQKRAIGLWRREEGQSLVRHRTLMLLHCVRSPARLGEFELAIYVAGIVVSPAAYRRDDGS